MDYPKNTMISNFEHIQGNDYPTNMSWFCLHEHSGLHISTATLDRIYDIKTLLSDHFDIVENMISEKSPQNHKCPWFWFSRLVIHSKHRGQGWGDEFMKEICKVADKKKFHILNGVNPYGEMSLEQTIAFYEKYRFVKFDSENPEALIRICE